MLTPKRTTQPALDPATGNHGAGRATSPMAAVHLVDDDAPVVRISDLDLARLARGALTEAQIDSPDDEVGGDTAYAVAMKAADQLPRFPWPWYQKASVEVALSYELTVRRAGARARAALDAALHDENLVRNGQLVMPEVLPEWNEHDDATVASVLECVRASSLCVADGQHSALWGVFAVPSPTYLDLSGFCTATNIDDLAASALSTLDGLLDAKRRSVARVMDVRVHRELHRRLERRREPTPS